jgi:O-antigen/teichoic acid export membrane protein
MSLKQILLKTYRQQLKYPGGEWARWTQKVGLAVLDQALFAGTNFAVNIVLARWLEPEAYGAFATAYAVFLLLGAFHTAVLTEPMLVFGAGKYVDQFHKYLRVLVYGHTALSVAISVVFALVALAMLGTGASSLAEALFGLVVASPFILLMWILRRAFYIHSRLHWAVAGGIVYLILMLAGMYVLYLAERLSPFSALLVMGIAGVCVNVLLMIRLRPEGRAASDNSIARLVLKDHWDYGKWSMPTTLLIWLPSNIYYILLPVFVGLAGSAGLRSILNLVMPILHANSAITIVLIPGFVRVLGTKGFSGFCQQVRLALGLFTASSALYWLFLITFGSQLIDWLYDGRYNQYAQLSTFILVGALPFSASFVAVLGGALRAVGGVNRIFWVYCVSDLVALTFGLGFLVSGGVTGALAGLLSSSIATGAMMAWFYYREKTWKVATP